MNFIVRRAFVPFLSLLMVSFLFILVGAACSYAAGQPENVVRATLPNGLRVIVVRNALAPVVATSVNYLVGSEEAPAGFPGTAHAQEHMMFRGSPGLTADQLADIGSAMGGNFNANTRESLTQYLYTVPSEDLDVALHIEAARMQGVLDTQHEWELERGAIEQEVAQDLSDPTYVLYSKLRAYLYAGTPYEHDALGTKSSFDKTDAAMLKRFHDAWYAPNNAILIVVGDVDPIATLGQIRTLFGNIEPKKLPPIPSIKLQPVQSTSFSAETDQPQGTMLIALRTAGLDSEDFPALEVLSDILSNHRFDLYGLVPKGLASDAGFALDPLPKAGLAYAYVEFPAGNDPKAIESEIKAILAKVAHDGVSSELVKAAVLQERRETEFQKNSISDLASAWSDAVALYGLNAPEEDLARIERVSVGDVDRVARKYLDMAHVVTAVMNPRGSGAPVASSGGYGGRESISLGETKPVELPDWAQAAIGRLAVPPSTLAPIVSTLANGLTLIVQPETVSDTVTIYGHIRNRPETETPPGKEGVGDVLNQLFPYGTEHLDRLSFQTALDEIGAEEHAGADFSVEVLAQDFDRGAGLLADNELHPNLQQQAMDVVRDRIAQIAAARNKSPSHLAQRALRKGLFSEDDPTLRESTPETVHSLTLDDVRSYYKSVYRPDLTTLIVIGNIDPERARQTIDKFFGSWTANGPKPETDLPVAAPNKAAQIVVPDSSRVQDSVVLAQNLALTRLDADYYALELGNAVLAGGFYATRLSNDLRKNSGLVYSVDSELETGRTRSAYVIEFASDPDKANRAAHIAGDEIRKMQTVPVGQDELNRAKAILLRRMPLQEASIAEIARALAARRDLDLPLDEPTRSARRFIALAPQDVQTAFQKWMRPGDLVQVTQGPAPP